MKSSMETENWSKRLQELADENNKLRRSVSELSMLNDLSVAISSSLDQEEIINTIVSKATCFIGARQGNITLIDENPNASGKLLASSSCNYKQESFLKVGSEFLQWMYENRKPMLVNNPEEKFSTRFICCNIKIDSLLAVPLTAQSKLVGILTVYNKQGEESFSEEDQRLLSIIASQSAQVIENARLNEKEQQLDEVKKEIRVANKIQEQLLPDELPSLEQYQLTGRNITAKTVGGDYYDFIKLDDHRWVICLGDVSGKGLPASLLMSNLQALIRGELPCYCSPGSLLESVNDKLFKNTDIEKFATLFVGILDTESNTLTYSNAGHEYPFLIHEDEEFDQLMTGGLPLGVMNNQRFEEETLEMQPGDKVVIYSDGITDNRNEEGQSFGKKRLTQLLKEKANTSGEELLEKLIEQSLTYSDNASLFDDMTAVVISKFE